MSERKPLIAGNWKMFKTQDEAAETARQLVAKTAGIVDVEVMIAPPFTALSQVADVIRNSPVALGAQNLYWEEEGAFTGEISPAMLVASGCRYVIIGHSERRQYFNETDETVNQKIKSAVSHGLIPVMCIGEKESEREADQTFSVLDRQMKVGLEELAADSLASLVIAYEPVWAIGTGKAATAEMAQEVHAFIRSWMDKNVGNPLAKAIRILYGGSVKPDNVKELMRQPDLDGALVGGASLEADTFSQLVHYQ
ncbi:MAG: triose-phosphate isomerase [Thermodesulfobacteriota bacterium]|nr:triose-phosphate isomerase [Thermodesulfobacteriota bacterium]